jgi:hypothetical protein
MPAPSRVSSSVNTEGSEEGTKASAAAAIVASVGARNSRSAPSSPARLSRATCVPYWAAEGVSVTESTERVPRYWGCSRCQASAALTAYTFNATRAPSYAVRTTFAESLILRVYGIQSVPHNTGGVTLIDRPTGALWKQ